MHKSTVFALALLFLGGCAGSPCPPREPVSAAPQQHSAEERTASAAVTEKSLPCGVLTTAGYRHTGPIPTGMTLDDTNLIVPEAAAGQTVRRYSVVNRTGWPAPFASFGGWWICVTRGEILAEPDSASPDAYGLIAIDDLAADQSTGERGQE